ncbi:MAG: M23 family metallopeptidase [Ghiorsea sp.]
MATAVNLSYQRLSVWLLLVLFCASFSGCARYDYTPRGVHIAKSKANYKHAKTSSKPSIYLVQKGDTLYRIGQRFGINYKQLAAKNAIAKPYTIYMGQRIYLKGVAPNHKAIPLPKHAKKAVKAKKQTHKSATKTTSKKVVKSAVHPVASRSHIKLHWPVKGKLSSKFGPRGTRMHDGIDIAANEGVSVHAAAAGEVVYADARLTGYGNLIIVRHSSDLFTAYAHNKVNLVKRGDKVSVGQRIAYVGSTGRSTGPHLHFEVRRGEMAVDPLAYLPK